MSGFVDFRLDEVKYISRFIVGDCVALRRFVSEMPDSFSILDSLNWNTSFSEFAGNFADGLLKG